MFDPATERPQDQLQEELGTRIQGRGGEFFDTGDLTPDGPTSTLRLMCHLRTADGVDHEYGVDSPLLGYSYYGEVLLDWIVGRLTEQRDDPGTPLEDVGALMVACGRPGNVLIGIGATRYTELGATTYLQPGDSALVRVYDTHDPAGSELRQLVRDR